MNVHECNEIDPQLFERACIYSFVRKWTMTGEMIHKLPHSFLTQRAGQKQHTCCCAILIQNRLDSCSARPNYNKFGKADLFKVLLYVRADSEPVERVTDDGIQVH